MTVTIANAIFIEINGKAKIKGQIAMIYRRLFPSVILTEHDVW